MLDVLVARELVHREKAARGPTVSDVSVAAVAPFAVPWSCLVGCWVECDFVNKRTQGPQHWGGEAHLWELLGLPGEHDGTDLAFRAAQTVLRASLSLDAAVPMVSGALLADPPAFVLDPSVEAARSHYERLEMSPEDMPQRLVILPSAGDQ
jgi:hypothetical protein